MSYDLKIVSNSRFLLCLKKLALTLCHWHYVTDIMSLTLCQYALNPCFKCQLFFQKYLYEENCQFKTFSVFRFFNGHLFASTKSACSIIPFRWFLLFFNLILCENREISVYRFFIGFYFVTISFNVLDLLYMPVLSVFWYGKVWKPDFLGLSGYLPVLILSPLKSAYSTFMSF